jgi:hypothetical protein
MKTTPKIPGTIARRRIALEGLITERRVLYAYRDPSKVLPCTLARVTRAALALGITPPPPVEKTA